jgi:hypothetical protein
LTSSSPLESELRLRRQHNIDNGEKFLPQSDRLAIPKYYGNSTEEWILYGNGITDTRTRLSVGDEFDILLDSEDSVTAFPPFPLSTALYIASALQLLPDGKQNPTGGPHARDTVHYTPLHVSLKILGAKAGHIYGPYGHNVWVNMEPNHSSS